MVRYEDDDKGEPIRIIGGVHCGLTGWRMVEKPDTRQYTNVILINESGKEVAKRIKKFHVEPFMEPEDFVQAALQQHSSLQRALTDVCRLFAQCGLKGVEAELYEAIQKSMQAASMQQASEGNKAKRLPVDWKSKDDSSRMS